LRRAALAFTIALLALGPAAALADDVADRMYSLASALTRLASAVESAVRYKNVSPDAGDEAVLDLATKHDRGLLEPFARYRLRVQRQGRDAVVLVCSRKHEVRLLEDAGCSARLDRHHWQSPVALPCEFTIDVATACPAPAPAR
jgi:hypothetical protein